MVFLQAPGLPRLDRLHGLASGRHRGNGEPGDEVIESHRLMARLVTELPRYYSALFGTPVDLKTALELAAIDRAAELRR